MLILPPPLPPPLYPLSPPSISLSSGRSVCGKHSSQNLPIRYYGYYTPVRCCDTCATVLMAQYRNPPPTTTTTTTTTPLPPPPPPVLAQAQQVMVYDTTPSYPPPPPTAPPPTTTTITTTSTTMTIGEIDPNNDPYGFSQHLKGE